jgi:hypothetical protein
VVASSASSGADEALVYDYPAPGTYVLSVQNWAATGGWTGEAKVFGAVSGTEVVVPAGIESWTITCERPDGKVVGTEQVVVDRGQRKAITACGTTRRGAKRPH